MVVDFTKSPEGVKEYQKLDIPYPDHSGIPEYLASQRLEIQCYQCTMWLELLKLQGSTQ